MISIRSHSERIQCGVTKSVVVTQELSLPAHNKGLLIPKLTWTFRVNKNSIKCNVTLVPSFLLERLNLSIYSLYFTIQNSFTGKTT